MKKTALSIIALSLIFSASCVSTVDYQNPGEKLERDGLQKKLTGIEHEKNTDKRSMYNHKNEISFLLDRGMLNHYAGNYAASNTDLQEAERLIEEAFTKSISDGFKAFTAKNPYKKEYIGEDFENIFTNVFGALNYYHLGKLEEAQVEVRRVNEKLVYIRDSYENLAARGRTSGGAFNIRDRTYYTNSALARYLSMLFWRGRGNDDSARIDAEEVTLAYTASPDIYYHSMPAEMVMKDSTCEELSIPGGMARINLLSFIGLSPVKSVVYSEFMEKKILARPFVAFDFRRSPVDRIEAVFDNGRRVNLSMLEDIGTVTQAVFQTRMGRIEDMKESLGWYAGPGYWIANDFSNKFKSKQKKEQAVDTRMGRYLPERAYVGGINLAPGTYCFSINYYNGDTLVESRRFGEVKAEEGKLNLIVDYNREYNLSRVPTELPAHIPDFAGRLPAPTGVSVYTRSASENVSYPATRWNEVPGAVVYYVYAKPEKFGNAYLIGRSIDDWGIAFDERTLEAEYKHNFTYYVIAAGRGGFSTPSDPAFGIAPEFPPPPPPEKKSGEPWIQAAELQDGIYDFIPNLLLYNRNLESFKGRPAHTLYRIVVRGKDFTVHFAGKPDSILGSVLWPSFGEYYTTVIRLRDLDKPDQAYYIPVERGKTQYGIYYRFEWVSGTRFALTVDSGYSTPEIILGEPDHELTDAW
jgi:hypothetical protein